MSAPANPHRADELPLESITRAPAFDDLDVLSGLAAKRDGPRPPATRGPA